MLLTHQKPEKKVPHRHLTMSSPNFFPRVSPCFDTSTSLSTGKLSTSCSHGVFATLRLFARTHQPQSLAVPKSTAFRGSSNRRFGTRELAALACLRQTRPARFPFSFFLLPFTLYLSTLNNLQGNCNVPSASLLRI